MKILKYTSKYKYFQQEICFTVSQDRALRLMKTIQQMNISRLTNLTDSTQNLQDTSLSSNLLNETKRIQDIE